MALPQKSSWIPYPEPTSGTEPGGQWLQSDNSLFGSWSDRVRHTFGRQMEALAKDQEERAFLATGHGSLYADAPSPTNEDKG